MGAAVGVGLVASALFAFLGFVLGQWIVGRDAAADRARIIEEANAEIREAERRGYLGGFTSSPFPLQARTPQTRPFDQDATEPRLPVIIREGELTEAELSRLLVTTEGAGVLIIPRGFDIATELREDGEQSR